MMTPDARGVPPLNLPLILGLALIALARPLTNIVADQLGAELPAAVPLGWTALITLVWVVVVGTGRSPHPVLTLVLAGLAYAVLAMVLSAVLSPLLLGYLDGPLARPLAIVPMLVVNALWGLIAGALALAVRRLRGPRSS
ncbi:hypothetical protein [Brachybacterium sp. YJGR34]|uniref:hypothetical protein n=1 Tax=Brachybacterium sp. YJGR34 TaxID=2059911 RepID=UPI000E0A34D2|nr:hypothetical protein [Brachybacterium sp. YJGR34]